MTRSFRRSTALLPKTLPHVTVIAALALTRGLVGAVSPGVDQHTVALWLFDEPTYPNVILTDAGDYQYDLRLQSAYGEWYLRTEGKGEPPAEPLHVAGKYGLLPGKFGNALYMPDPKLASIIWPDNRQRYSSATMVGTDVNIPERFNLGYLDWTIEFWFRARGEQTEPATLFELSNEQDYHRGLPMENSLRMSADRSSFVVTSRSTSEVKAFAGSPASKDNFKIVLRIPTDAAQLGDGEWHHVAFCYTADERQIRHYIDGRLQPLPEKGGFLPMLGVLKKFTIESNLNGLLDEYRISDVVRYPGDFPPPSSFSKAYGRGPKQVNEPDGPPLLFPGGKTVDAIVNLGSRKHVFIDGALLESRTNLAFRAHPPLSRQETDFRNTEAWEPTPRMGSTIPDICSVLDDGDGLRMYYTNSGMWGGKRHNICVAFSDDGLHWTKPVLNMHEWEGTLATNIILDNASQGSVIEDPNPATPASERYKYVAWSMYRGYYVYTSPDGIHFKRNETVALPFDTDGSSTFFWDDQRGEYHTFIRAVSQDPKMSRRTGQIRIPDLMKPWPFSPQPLPWIDDLVLARPAIGEVQIVDTGGQVYRFKAHKYAWAPDVYIAFPWRYIYGENVRPGSFMMVSRDGTNWTRYEDPYYFPGGWDLNGRAVIEALMEDALIRRGTELWQYGTVRFTEHGGILYGGVEHDGGVHDRLLRLTQRLDGFVAASQADTSKGAASLVTKPLTFTGDHLELNVDASGGSVRVELQDESGKPIKGFSLSDCAPVRENGAGLTVAWKAGQDLGALSGKTVRVRIELTGAQLFALQFR